MSGSGLSDQRLQQADIIRITTFRADGSAATVPIWFAVDGDRVYISTLDGSKKVVNITGDSRVRLRIGKGEGAARLSGRAELVYGGSLFDKARDLIYEKYRPRSRMAENIRQATPGRVVIAITPDV